MEVINNGYVPKKRNEKKKKNERRYKKFIIYEYQLVSGELWKTIERMWIMLDKNYKDIISNIKEEIINT